MIMVQMQMKVQTPGERIKAKVARKIGSMVRPGIRVVPKNETLRRILKHASGIAFRSEGGVEWPDDMFTRKRLRDGSVRLEEAPQQQQDQSSTSRRASRSEQD
jgi:hypothetical protein